MFDSTEYPYVKKDTIDTLNNYARLGLEPGDFCLAVLENNLMESLGRADIENRATLFEICSYVYNELPSGCHGSKEIVRAWFRKLKKEEK